jgi:hypothetical protein
MHIDMRPGVERWKRSPIGGDQFERANPVGFGANAPDSYLVSGQFGHALELVLDTWCGASRRERSHRKIREFRSDIKRIRPCQGQCGSLMGD